MKQLFHALFITGSIGLMSSCTHPQPVIAPPAKEISTPLLGWERKNPYAIFFEAERLNTTHVESVGPVATFRFIVRNAVPDQRYILASQNLGGPIRSLCEYVADDDGSLGRALDEGTMMMDNDCLLMFDFFKGEPVQYFLTSADGQTSLSTVFVPYPIQIQASDEAEIQIRRLTQDARLLLCEGNGFLPDEEIYISSQSTKERISDIPCVCIDGRFSMLLEPKTLGKSGGGGRVEVQRESEKLVLEYDWGCQAINPKKKEANSTRMKQNALSKLSTNLDE